MPMAAQQSAADPRCFWQSKASNILSLKHDVGGRYHPPLNWGRSQKNHLITRFFGMLKTHAKPRSLPGDGFIRATLNSSMSCTSYLVGCQLPIPNIGWSLLVNQTVIPQVGLKTTNIQNHQPVVRDTVPEIGGFIILSKYQVDHVHLFSCLSWCNRERCFRSGSGELATKKVRYLQMLP